MGDGISFLIGNETLGPVVQSGAGGGHGLYSLIVKRGGASELNRRVFHGHKEDRIPMAKGGPSGPLPALARALVAMHWVMMHRTA